MVRGTRGLPMLMVWLVPDTAHACPFCESPTAEQVRAGIFDANFISQLGATLLPFVVMLAIVAVIHHGPSQDQREKAETQSHEGPKNSGA